MRQIISVRDLEEMLRNGKDVRSLGGDVLLTPSARDFLRELETSGDYKAGPASVVRPVRPVRPVTSQPPSLS